MFSLFNFCKPSRNQRRRSSVSPENPATPALEGGRHAPGQSRALLVASPGAAAGSGEPAAAHPDLLSLSQPSRSTPLPKEPREPSSPTPLARAVSQAWGAATEAANLRAPAARTPERPKGAGQTMAGERAPRLRAPGMREPASDLGAGLPASLGPLGERWGAGGEGCRGRPWGSSGLLSKQTLVCLEEGKRGVRGLSSLGKTVVSLRGVRFVHAP